MASTSTTIKPGEKTGKFLYFRSIIDKVFFNITQERSPTCSRRSPARPSSTSNGEVPAGVKNVPRKAPESQSLAGSRASPNHVWCWCCRGERGSLRQPPTCLNRGPCSCLVSSQGVQFSNVTVVSGTDRALSWRARVESQIKEGSKVCDKVVSSTLVGLPSQEVGRTEAVLCGTQESLTKERF